MIKVLHYIQSTGMGKDDSALKYVNALIRSTKDETESYVVTQEEMGSNWISFSIKFNKLLKQTQPDIIHIHGSWNYYTALADKFARKKGFFTVISPHGLLTPKMTDDPEFWKKKVPRIFLYQLGMIRNTKYLIATDEEEAEDLKMLGWKRRITVVKASDKDCDDTTTCTQLIAAYNKVIDTNYPLRITEEETRFVKKCLRASLWQNDCLPEELIPSEEEKEQVAKLSKRRISLYAYDNHITQLFTEGAKRIGITLNDLPDAENLPRFKQKKQEKGRHEKKIEKICSIISNLAEGVNINVDYTPTGKLSLLTFGNIYSALRFNDYNEDDFCTQIKKKFVMKTAKRLMTKLQEDFGLETGFLPILP